MSGPQYQHELDYDRASASNRSSISSASFFRSRATSNRSTSTAAAPSHHRLSLFIKTSARPTTALPAVPDSLKTPRHVQHHSSRPSSDAVERAALSRHSQDSYSLSDSAHGAGSALGSPDRMTPTAPAWPYPLQPQPRQEPSVSSRYWGRVQLRLDKEQESRDQRQGALSRSPSTPALQDPDNRSSRATAATSIIPDDPVVVQDQPQQSSLTIQPSTSRTPSVLSGNTPSSQPLPAPPPSDAVAHPSASLYPADTASQQPHTINHRNHSLPRPQQDHGRSYTQTRHDEAAPAVLVEADGSSSRASKASYRQSMHSGATSASQGVNHPLPPTPNSQPPPAPVTSAGRGAAPEEPTPEETAQVQREKLGRDHQELREKYTKVKKYYFEKEEQVKQLQNLLAHQRIASSRTSLDDNEYTTRLNRLDGLIAQLAYAIRKSWKAVPQWLAGHVNKDAMQLGKHEMTAAGRAFISCWLHREVFDKYFHPDLDLNLSAQLKTIQGNIKQYSPPSQTLEEEEQLNARVVVWRQATIDGLQDVIRSSQAEDNRAHLIELLNQQLIAALRVHLSDPPMSDLEGGVSMIVELAVSTAAHIALESRDVQIEYFWPGTPFSNDFMKQENGIPRLEISVQEDVAEGMSLRSAADSEDQAYHDSAVAADQHQKASKRGKLIVRTAKKSHATPSAAQGRNHGAGASTGSLLSGTQQQAAQQRPDSSGKDDGHPRVRMAVGLATSVRGKNVLVKAPVHVA